MNFSDLMYITNWEDYKIFSKNEWVTLTNVDNTNTIDMHLEYKKVPQSWWPFIYSFKDDYKAMGYMYILNKLYNSGMKSVKLTYEQCLVFENIEIDIPFSQYKQPYETMVVEFPEKYRNLLSNRTKLKAPIGIVCHKPSNESYMIGGVSYGSDRPNITFFIRRDETNLEWFISQVDEETKADDDYLVFPHIERVALNTLLFMTYSGFNKVGFANIKQHRHYERKEPIRAKQDFYYYELNQEISLYKREIIKSSVPRGGTHESPKPHWRKGHWRTQHYGPANSLIKPKFIQAVFVCSEAYKGDMSDTTVVYK
jgi:hypothetical protein